MTDCTTGLMWEQKTGSDGSVSGLSCPGNSATDPHNVNNCYTWSGPSYGTTYIADGKLYTQFLAALNSDVVAYPLGSAPTGCFAQHCDWRIPQISELRSILTAEYPNCTSAPCIDPAFEPTGPSDYWSSSSTASDPIHGWFVDLRIGSVEPRGEKYLAGYARAVRGGR